MMNADLQRLFTEQGETATVAGQANVQVVANSRGEGGIVDDMGIMPEADLELIIRPSALSVTPAKGSLVTFKSKNYRVDNIRRDQDDNAISLFCTDVSQ